MDEETGVTSSATSPLTGPQVVDRVGDIFPLERSEAEWLLTLLSADDLHYIFEGTSDEGQS